MKNLKLTFLASLLFCFLGNVAMAQLGVKAGYNLSSLKYFSDNDENFNEEFISGYQIGAVYNIGLGDRLSLQPEASYFTNGGRSDFEPSLGETSFQNLDLAALLNLNILGSNDGFALQVSGGLFARYALSAKIESDAVGEINIDFTEDDEYQRVNSGYILGAGVKLNNLILSLRTAIGITELASFDSSLFSGEVNFKSRDFSLVGILLF